jgi:hypothetical protein
VRIEVKDLDGLEDRLMGCAKNVARVAATRKVAESEVSQVKRVQAQRLADLASVHESEIAKREETIASKTVSLENARVAEEHYERETELKATFARHDQFDKDALAAAVAKREWKCRQRVIRRETRRDIYMLTAMARFIGKVPTVPRAAGDDYDSRHAAYRAMDDKPWKVVDAEGNVQPFSTGKAVPATAPDYSVFQVPR